MTIDKRLALFVFLALLPLGGCGDEREAYVGPRQLLVGQVVKIKVDGRRGVLIRYGGDRHNDYDWEHKVLVRIAKHEDSIGFMGGWSRYAVEDFYPEELEPWKEEP